MKRLTFLVALALTACGGGTGASGDGPGIRGVSDTEIRLGQHSDLSGPLASWGVPITNAYRMRFEEANEAGGIHGRQIRFFVEDAQYQVPLAVKSVNKLLNVDDVFAMVGAMGTPANNAVFGALETANVPNVFPASAGIQMAEPLHRLKFSQFINYRDQAIAAIRFMAANSNAESICLQALATDYGEESVTGFDMVVEELGLEVGYRGRHKPTEIDFTGTVTSIKNSDCDIVFLGALIKDAIQIYTAAREAGVEAPIVSNMVSYIPEIAGAGPAMEGMLTVAPFLVPDFGGDLDPGSFAGDWSRRYKARFNVEPAPQAVTAYLGASLVVEALENAGPDLTVDTFVAGLEAISAFEDPFGGPSLSLGPQKHHAANNINLYVVENGRWVLVAEDIAEQE